jgi:hypothetical protein
MSKRLGIAEPQVQTFSSASATINQLKADDRKRRSIRSNLLARLIYNMLASRSERMHYSLITMYVNKEKAGIKLTDAKTLLALKSRPDLFIDVGDGYYWLASKIEGDIHNSI